MEFKIKYICYLLFGVLVMSILSLGIVWLCSLQSQTSSYGYRSWSPDGFYMVKTQRFTTRKGGAIEDVYYVLNVVSGENFKEGSSFYKKRLFLGNRQVEIDRDDVIWDLESGIVTVSIGEKQFVIELDANISKRMTKILRFTYVTEFTDQLIPRNTSNYFSKVVHCNNSNSFVVSDGMGTSAEQYEFELFQQSDSSITMRYYSHPSFFFRIGNMTLKEGVESISLKDAAAQKQLSLPYPNNNDSIIKFIRIIEDHISGRVVPSEALILENGCVYFFIAPKGHDLDLNMSHLSEWVLCLFCIELQ